MTNQSNQQSQLKKKEPMTEIWKDVPGYGGLYQASNTGHLRTHNWKNTGATRIMKPGYDANGYLRTVFVNPYTRRNKTIKVHRIVGLTWIKDYSSKPEINHKNGIKDDNRIENLEWVTHKENFDHSVVNGKQPHLFKKGQAPHNKGITTLAGSQIGTSLLLEHEVIEIRLKYKPRIYTRQMLAVEYGVTEGCIKDVVCKRSWKHI